MIPYKSDSVAILRATTSGSKIVLRWSWVNETIPKFIEKVKVYLMIEGGSDVKYAQVFDSSLQTEHVINDIMIDVKYKVCLMVTMTKQWTGNSKLSHVCEDVSNRGWEVSALIGSTAGAIVAILLILLLLFFSKRAKKRQKSFQSDLNEKSKRNRFDSAFESQFDSMAIREDTSFYDDYVTSDVSCYDNSHRMQSDSNINPSITTPVTESTAIKIHKKKTSLIEEESNGGTSQDESLTHVGFKDTFYPYQSGKSDNSQSNPQTEELKPKIMETCIDELSSLDNSPNKVDIASPNDVVSTHQPNPCKRVESDNIVTDCVEQL